MIKVLRLDCPGVRATIAGLKVLQGKKPIARGCFSAVYDGQRPNTVLKLTADNLGYSLLNDAVIGIGGRHLPRIVKDFFCVGDTNINGEDFPLYLYEMERLEKIKTGSPERRLVRQIVKHASAASATSKRMWRDPNYITDTLKVMVENPNLTKSWRHAFSGMLHFCRNTCAGSLDLHSGNFMRRANGEVVMIDPIANMDLYRRAELQLVRRKW